MEHRRGPRATRPLIGGLAWAFMGMAGCDNTPNPNFQQEITRRLAADAGDRYAALEKAPKVYLYGGWKEHERAARAAAEAQQFKGTYETLLAQWDQEPISDAFAALAARCRSAFGEAMGYHTQGPRADLVEEGRTATGAFEALRECRERAVKAGKASDLSEADALIAATLRRFASSGMVLVGVTSLSRGSGAAGFALWRDGGTLLDEDKSGFQLSLKSLRGW